MPLNSPSQFEPLLPEKEVERLLALARESIESSMRLTGKAHHTTLRKLRELVRAMNSYYSNRIEGQGTHPLNIERALGKDFSAKPAVARLQRIAVAHIEAEKQLEAEVQGGKSALTVEFVRVAHAAMFSRLSPDDRRTGDGALIEPGAFRREGVTVGAHVPPEPAAIPRFLTRYEEAFGTQGALDTQLLKIACAHHRLAWIHPFRDGNGRAVRLVTHAALHAISGGLWSVNRGLARRREEYYARLAGADEARRGDTDGRGNLSEEGLRHWCEFFLEECIDQVSFMTRMLDLDGMKTRIQALVTFRAATRRLRIEAALPLYHLFAAGPLSRAEFKQMTGLRDRSAQGLLSALLSQALVESDAPLGPVRFGLPLDALQFLLPGLYPEVDSQAE
jgi:Fic family protein